jgi:uncharacterized membrane protein
MKKSKRHTFYHADPEKIVPKNIAKENSSQVQEEDRVPDFVYRDLKRTAVIVGLFILLVVVLYFVQIKTGLMSPVLKKFGI